MKCYRIGHYNINNAVPRIIREVAGLSLENMANDILIATGDTSINHSLISNFEKKRKNYMFDKNGRDYKIWDYYKHEVFDNFNELEKIEVVIKIFNRFRRLFNNYPNGYPLLECFKTLFAPLSLDYDDYMQWFKGAIRIYNQGGGVHAKPYYSKERGGSLFTSEFDIASKSDTYYLRCLRLTKECRCKTLAEKMGVAESEIVRFEHKEEKWFAENRLNWFDKKYREILGYNILTSSEVLESLLFFRRIKETKAYDIYIEMLIGDAIHFGLLE